MSENVAQKIGNNIRLLREKRFMSQENLAKHMHMARPGISIWENGRSEPSSSQLVELAKIFNVSLDMLVGNSRDSCNVVIVDTSVLVNRPSIVDELIHKFDEIIIPDIVIAELNHLKDSHKRLGQCAWLAMAGVQKGIDDKSIKYVESPKKDGKNDERIAAIAIARAHESLGDKIYVFSHDIWFSFLIKEKKLSNLESLTFALYDEKFKEVKKFDLIKTQGFFSFVKNNKLVDMKNLDLHDVNINKVDTESGFTPLIQAVRNRNLEMVKFLISLPNIDLNGKDFQKYKFTALHHASQLQDSAFDIFKTLIEHGADIDIGSEGENKGNTPLMVCAWGGFKKGVEYLLEQGACLNQQDNNGYTALIKACMRSHYDIAQLLIKKTDVNIRSRENKRAIEYISPNNSLARQFLELFKDVETKEGRK